MGQICKPLVDVDAASLNYELVNTTLGKNHYFRTLFPLKEVSRFTIKTLEAEEGLPIAARRVAFNTKNPLFTRKDIGSFELSLGKIAASRDMDEIQIQEYRDLQAIASASNDPAAAREMVEMAYNDVRFVEQALPAKVELDALGIASLGKQVFNRATDGEMQTNDEIDFNVPATNFGGASVVWSNASTADGLADIVAMQQTIAAKGFGTPMFCYMEKQKYQQLIAQEKTCKRLFPAAKLLNVYSSGMVDINAINAYMDAHGYPHIIVIDSWVGYEALDGTKSNVKPWNVNVVTLSLTMQLGHTYWKRKFIEAADDKVAIETAGEFYNVSIVGERNPDKVTTSGEAYVQVGLINRRTLGFLNTAATTWNNGAE